MYCLVLRRSWQLNQLTSSTRMRWCLVALRIPRTSTCKGRRQYEVVRIHLMGCKSYSCSLHQAQLCGFPNPCTSERLRGLWAVISCLQTEYLKLGHVDHTLCWFEPDLCNPIGLLNCDKAGGQSVGLRQRSMTSTSPNCCSGSTTSDCSTSQTGRLGECTNV